MSDSRKGAAMITNVKARYSNGVLTPLEPLDLEEGKEVVVSIEDTAPAGGFTSIVEMVENLQKDIPPSAWDNLPTDLAKSKKHYLYGHPKEDD